MAITNDAAGRLQRRVVLLAGIILTSVISAQTQESTTPDTLVVGKKDSGDIVRRIGDQPDDTLTTYDLAEVVSDRAVCTM